MEICGSIDDPIERDNAHNPHFYVDFARIFRRGGAARGPPKSGLGENQCFCRQTPVGHRRPLATEGEAGAVGAGGGTEDAHTHNNAH